MITRSKLVEQLKLIEKLGDYQIASQHKCNALTIFSPKPHITSRADVILAIFLAFVFTILIISSYMAIYFSHLSVSFLLISFGILLPIRLRISRQALARKMERRLLLPLSM